MRAGPIGLKIRIEGLLRSRQVADGTQPTNRPPRRKENTQ
jgi:hypothetical protein